VHQGYYQNSNQGNAYAYIVDYITKKNNPQTFYFIAEFPKLGQQVFDFWKTPQDKMAWIPQIALDLHMIETMMKAKHFPMNGKACMDFFRPCKYLGVCNMNRMEQWKPHKVESSDMYDFDFTLEELLAARGELYGN